MHFFVGVGVLIMAFTFLHFTCAVVASRLIADIQTTPLGRSIQEAAENTQRDIAKRAYFYGGDVLGFHPMNEGVWVAIFKQMGELPPALRRRARMLRNLRRLQLALWVGAVLLILGRAVHVI